MSKEAVFDYHKELGRTLSQLFGHGVQERPNRRHSVRHYTASADIQRKALQETLDRFRSAAAKIPGKTGQRTKRKAAQRVLAILYPDGIPDLPYKLLCAAVARHLPFPVSDDTILRAAGRK